VLASGGSGLWNSVLTYVLKLKDINEALATIADQKAKIATAIEKSSRDTAGLPARAEAIAKLDSVAIVASRQ
jgi:hypothetical protein